MKRILNNATQPREEREEDQINCERGREGGPAAPAVRVDKI